MSNSSGVPADSSSGVLITGDRYGAPGSASDQTYRTARHTERLGQQIQQRGIGRAADRRGVHLDRRFSPVKADREHPPGVVEYLWHGLGFGGSCFPKDVAALQGFGHKLGTPTAILDAVLNVNRLQPMRILSLLEQEMALGGRTIAILGLAFKPGTDDLRHSPAIPVVEALMERGAHVVVHDPIAMPGAKHDPVLRHATFAVDWQSAVKGADACCLITRWPEYREIQPADFSSYMNRPLVIDGRGLFDPVALAKAGVKWKGIGYTPEAAGVAAE